MNKKKDSHKLNYGENNPFDAIRDALAEREKREKTPFLSEEALLSVFKSIFSVSYHRLQNIKKKTVKVKMHNVGLYAQHVIKDDNILK